MKSASYYIRLCKILKGGTYKLECGWEEQQKGSGAFARIAVVVAVVVVAVVVVAAAVVVLIFVQFCAN